MNVWSYFCVQLQVKEQVIGYTEVDVVKNRVVDNVNLKYPPSVFDTIGLVSTFCFEIIYFCSEIYTFLKILLLYPLLSLQVLLQRNWCSQCYTLSWCSLIFGTIQLFQLIRIYESPIIFYFIEFKSCWIHHCTWFQLLISIAVVGHTYRGDAEAEEYGIWCTHCVEAGCSFSSSIHNNEYGDYQFSSHASQVYLELS